MVHRSEVRKYNRQQALMQAQQDEHIAAQRAGRPERKAVRYHGGIALITREQPGEEFVGHSGLTQRQLRELEENYADLVQAHSSRRRGSVRHGGFDLFN